MKDTILAIIGLVFANNVVLNGLYGIFPMMSTGKKNKTILTLGLSTMCVSLLTTVVVYFLQDLLNKAGLLVLAVIALNVLFSFVFNLVASKVCKEYASNAKMNFPMIAMNASVFGIVLKGIASESLVFVFVTPIVAALGMMVAMYIYSAIRYSINDKYVPKAFKGLPIDFMIAAIMALAFAALA